MKDKLPLVKKKVEEQSGIKIYHRSLKRDAGRLAMFPGYRVSKSGNVYYEDRPNRSDMSKTGFV